ncbi:MAG TPA: hypothetical protein ENH15_03300 [Actinobacteria bacterium]|nr:hypothetical protein [Actinomycetota bacterium]
MALKRKEPEADNELRWLTTYGDVVTLMMAFFVMLYAISQVDQQKFLLFVSGLEDVFQNESVSEGLLEGGEALVGAASNEPEEGDAGIEGIQILDGMPTRDNDSPPPPPPPPTDPGAPDRHLLTQQDLVAVREAISAAFAAADFGTVPTFEIDSRGLVVAIATDGVLFQTGQFTISDGGEEILGILAPILADFDNQILVEGHTDSVPLNNSGYTNWNLSADRALAVLNIMDGTYGIEPTRLSATGYGEYRPKASNETPEGRSANRRVELVIVASTNNPTIPDLIGGTDG